MEKALLIIDMQSRFKAAKNRRTINNCIREIDNARNEHRHTIIIEYSGCCPTMQRIRNHQRYYYDFDYLYKYADGGGDVVLDHFKKMQYDITHVRVCGVNTEFCVYQTIKGIHDDENIKEIELVFDAINSESSLYRNKENVIALFSSLNKVKII